MNTLFDFVTYVKGVEYLVAIAAIAGYIIYWEFLKHKPFRTLVHTGREDLRFIKQIGYKNTFKTVGKVVAAPFVGLTYVIILPFAFCYTLGLAAINGILSMAGKSVSFEWRPSEAYLAGKKTVKKEEKEENKDESK